METVTEICQTIFAVLIGLSGCVGLLALASPKAFAAVATFSSQTVYHGIAIRPDESRIDIDGFVLKNGRVFGLIVVMTVGYLWSVSRYGPESYPKSTLMVVILIAICMGAVSLFQLSRQQYKIETTQHHANTDALTGLLNRRSFELELSRRLAQKQRQGIPFCLVMFDVDGFKLFNDNFGHLHGDRILKDIADVLQTTAREMDFLARLGGDEFVALLPHVNLEVACQVAERFRFAVSSKEIRCDDTIHKATVSVGVAEADVDDDPASLLKRCDAALYAAKTAGKDCCYRQGGPEPALPARCQ